MDRTHQQSKVSRFEFANSLGSNSDATERLAISEVIAVTPGRSANRHPEIIRRECIQRVVVQEVDR